MPDMVQVGNEINHGMMWPEGHVSHFDSLAQLFKAGADAVRAVDPSIVIMQHLALGGQNDEAVWYLNNMFSRGVDFDVIGLSYYPKWHGTISDLQNNLRDLSQRYNKDVIVVEYSQLKKEVNDAAFNVPENRGKGTFIWEPLSWGETVVDKSGNSNELLNVYDEIAKEYLK
jgi:beta-galactosidase